MERRKLGAGVVFLLLSKPPFSQVFACSMYDFQSSPYFQIKGTLEQLASYNFCRCQEQIEIPHLKTIERMEEDFVLPWIFFISQTFQ